MKSISTKRLGLLVQQHWIYNRKLILLSLGGFTAGLFVFLYGFQTITDFHPWGYTHFFVLLVFLFTVLSVAYSGFSFPGLRSKEKAHSYFMTPTTIAEKFWFEFITRIVLFIVIMPLLYWIIFTLEGYFVTLLHPEYQFQSFSFFQEFDQSIGLKVFTMGEGLLLLTAPFLGAILYRKYPIIKTFLWAVLIIILHIIVFYFLQKNDIRFDNRETGRVIAGIYIWLINVVLITRAYFKLKGKQV